MFSLRHSPALALLLSCSIYDDALLRPGGQDLGGVDARASGGSGNPLAGDGSVTGGGGGRSPGSPGPSAGGAGLDGDVAGGEATAGGGDLLGATAGAAPTTGSIGTGGSDPSGSGVDVLDDMEDGNFYLAPQPPRYGYWYVSGDATVGASLPKIEELVAILAPARGASASAVHFAASGFKGWGASLGLTFTDASSKRAAYDTGDAIGISFWLRGSVAGGGKVRVLLPLLGTDPLGQKCGANAQLACLDHFSLLVPVSEEWVQHTILFSALHQAGWGVPLAEFNPHELLGIEWSAGTAVLDFWLDDLALLRPA